MSRDEVVAHGHGAHGAHGSDESEIQLPSPTSAPIIFAVGLTLMFLGLVTHWLITLLGFLLVVPGVVGWFLEVLPHEKHEGIPVTPEELSIAQAQFVTLERPPEHQRHAVQAVTNFSMWTGVKGGIAGGVAMTVPAALYGIIGYHSVWYAINLLAAGGFTSWATETNAFMAEFHLKGLLAATAIHGTTSLLVGLLYAAMLPIFPRKPILTAGFIMPLLWTGLIYTSLGIVSPILNQRIDWPWFVISQVAFGLVAGFVVNLDANVRNAEFRALPFAVRAGLHTDQPSDLKERPTERVGRMGYINESLHAGDDTDSGKGFE